MSYLIAVIIALIVGAIAGALVFRKHQARIEVDASKISNIAKTVKDTTKGL